MAIEQNAILNVNEVAKILRVSKDTIYTMVRQNTIPHKTIRRQIRFLGWQINDWLKRG
jgi:excisionase family DNA binding protein